MTNEIPQVHAGLGYDQITTEKLDRLFHMWTSIDHQAEAKGYEDTHLNTGLDAAIENYNRAKREADAAKAKPKPQFSFVARGKPRHVDPEWAMYQYYLHRDYNNTIADFLAGTR